MTRTTPPRPVDIAELFPELRDHCATTTRLHPRPGTPGVGDSSIGGPPRWPAGEPEIDPAGVVLGRVEDLNLFHCPASFDHPLAAAGQ